MFCVNFKNKFFSFLSEIDIFAFPINNLFQFKGKNSYSTAITKIMTILVISLTLGCLIYFSNNFKNNPITGFKEDFVVNSDEVSIDSDNFFFTFGMENPLNFYINFIDNTIYVAEATINIWDFDSQKTIYQNFSLEIEPCNSKHFPTKEYLKREFMSLNSTLMYCLKDYTKAKIKGTWAAGSLQTIDITFRPCDNSTENNTCKSPELISQMIEGSYLSIQYTSVSPKLYNFDEPIKTNLIYDYYQTSLELTNNVNLIFGKQKVETVSGFFNQDEYYAKGVSYLRSKTYSYVNKLDKTFFLISLSLDPSFKIYTRKYDSIVDILSKMGGIIKILTIFATLILKPFLSSAISQRISNQTFDSEEIRKSQGFEKPHKMGFLEFVKLKLRKSYNLDQTTSIIKKRIRKVEEKLDISFLINKMLDIEKIKDDFNKEMEFLNCSWFSFFISIFFKNQKSKFIFESKELVNENIDKGLFENLQKKSVLLLNPQSKIKLKKIELNNEFEQKPNGEKDRLFKNKKIWVINDENNKKNFANPDENINLNLKKRIKTQF